MRMQTQFDRSYRNNIRNIALGILFILLILSLSACNQEEFEVLNVDSALSALYFLPEGEHATILTLSFEVTSDDSVVEVQIITPDKNSRWVVSAQKDEAGRFTVGPLSMGKGNALSAGDYSMIVLNSRGKTIDHTFTVRPLSTDIDPQEWGNYDVNERLLTLNRSGSLQVGDARLELAQGEAYRIADGIDEFYVSFDHDSTIVRVTL